MFFLRKFTSLKLRVFFLYLIVFSSLLILNIAISVFNQYESFRLLFLRIAVAAEFCLLAFFFSVLYRIKYFKYLSYFLMVLFIVVNLFLKLDLRSMSYALVIQCLFLIFLAILYFFEKIKFVEPVPLYFSTTFWICVGILIYSSGNIFAFVYLESAEKNSTTSWQLLYIYTFIIWSKNLIFSSAIIFGKEPKKQQENISVPENLYLDDFPSNDNTA